MVGSRNTSRFVFAVPLLAVLAGPAFGQPHDIYPSRTSTSTIELYYGTRPVSRPQPVVPILRVPQLPPLVVPAIAHTHTPITPPPLPLLDPTRTNEAVEGVLDAFRLGTDSMSTAAGHVLERVAERLAAGPASRKPAKKDPPAVLPTSVPGEVEVSLPAPVALPTLNNVTPLKVPAAEPLARESTVRTDDPPALITLTQDRLISALGITIGVAAGLGFALALVIFLRRPNGSAWSPAPASPVTVAFGGPAPVVISEKGLPRVDPTVSQSLPEPERFDPSLLQDAPRRSVEQRRPRTEQAVVQFILDQNLAVLSAIGPTRSHEPSYATDVAAPVRIG